VTVPLLWLLLHLTCCHTSVLTSKFSKSCIQMHFCRFHSGTKNGVMRMRCYYIKFVISLASAVISLLKYDYIKISLLSLHLILTMLYISLLKSTLFIYVSYYFLFPTCHSFVTFRLIPSLKGKRWLVGSVSIHFSFRTGWMVFTKLSTITIMPLEGTRSDVSHWTV